MKRKDMTESDMEAYTRLVEIIKADALALLSKPPNASEAVSIAADVYRLACDEAARQMGIDDTAGEE